MHSLLRICGNRHLHTVPGRVSPGQRKEKQAANFLLHIVVWTHAARSSREEQLAFLSIVFAKKAYGKEHTAEVFSGLGSRYLRLCWTLLLFCRLGEL